jgi:small subunit ribosomal protein S6
METVVKRKLYEGMFLVDSAQAADWDATKAVLEGVLKRANADILEMKKWDDRRLAYEINKKARGAYILCYFNADCDKIHDVEKAVQLSEQIMRVLILNTEQMSEDDMKRDTPAMKAEKEVAAAEEARAARTAKAAEGAESAPAVEGDEAAATVEAAEEFKESGEAEGSDAGEANMKKEFGNGKL